MEISKCTCIIYIVYIRFTVILGKGCTFSCFILSNGFASTLVQAGYVEILKILFSYIIVEGQSIKVHHSQLVSSLLESVAGGGV